MFLCTQACDQIFLTHLLYGWFSRENFMSIQAVEVLQLFCLLILSAENEQDFYFWNAGLQNKFSHFATLLRNSNFQKIIYFPLQTWVYRSKKIAQCSFKCNDFKLTWSQLLGDAFFLAEDNLMYNRNGCMCNHNDSLMLYIHSTDWSLGRKEEKKNHQSVNVDAWHTEIQREERKIWLSRKGGRHKAEGKWEMSCSQTEWLNT